MASEWRSGGLAEGVIRRCVLRVAKHIAAPRPCHLDTGRPHWPKSLAKYKIAEAPMTIVDSQVHAYEANGPKRPWHSVPNWPDHVTGDEMVAAMDKVGVDGAIFISAFSLYRYDA